MKNAFFKGSNYFLFNEKHGIHGILWALVDGVRAKFLSFFNWWKSAKGTRLFSKLIEHFAWWRGCMEHLVHSCTFKCLTWLCKQLDKAICKSCVGSLFELSTLMFDLMKWNENSEYSELIPTLQKHFTKDYCSIFWLIWT